MNGRKSRQCNKAVREEYGEGVEYLKNKNTGQIVSEKRYVHKQLKAKVRKGE